MYALLKDRKGDKNVAEWKSKARATQGLLVHGGMSDFSVDGTTHTVTEREQHAFAGWINRYGGGLWSHLASPACFPLVGCDEPTVCTRLMASVRAAYPRMLCCINGILKLLVD
jgi:hypothetical protein